MTRTLLVRALFAGTAMMMSTAAFAQQEEPQPDPSDATADAAIAAAADVDDAQAKIELLQAQVEALQESLVQVQASIVKTTPTWKGAPLYEDKDAGWSFKPRGRIQYDVGYVSNPNDMIVTRNLGFNTRARRIRLGAEGTIPGGLGYKFEMDYANGAVGFGDVVLTYTPKNTPFNLTIGNQETLNGLEQISSSRFSSFVERAAFDDAFINTRRIGLNVGYANKAGNLRLNAGLFAAHSIDSQLDNDGWIGATRAVYSPLMGSNQMHFGINYQHRKFQSNNGATVAASSGQPSINQLARYRARPFTQLTDQRFVDTGNFAARSDDIIGLEAAGIFKSLHIAAEGQYLKANGYDKFDKITVDPGDPTDVLDFFPAASQYVANGNPSFWGGYVEAGYFLTGETRGYKAGAWDRTKVLKPFSKGGSGAFQIIGRVDYLDLDSSKLRGGCTNNFVTGAACTTAASQAGKGGKQLGLLGGLTWIPEDYMRILLNYSHAKITGGPLAATVKPTSTDPINKRKYGNDTVQARFQVDF
ncbi:MAG: OprO/OprP family phosphate-selective porin [Sphingomonas bacterium]|nr:OprO/OprP family phosphate-selective porin [Sphingomonas bacterium]